MDGAVHRRTLLRWSAVGAAGLALAPRVLRAAALREGAREAPRDVGRKFEADGRVRRFAGSTVICHLPQQGPDSAAFDVLLDFYRAAPGHGFARRIALLPPSSYHMTVFGGVNDIGRNSKTWPAGIPIDTPIGDCNRIIGERLQAAGLPRIERLAMKVDANDSGDDGNTLRIPLTPADAGELARIEDLRAAIARTIGVPVPVSGTYQFHITLAYTIAPFDEAERRDALAVMAEWKRRLVRRVPVIALGTPEYCTFEDMFAFKREFYVGS